MVKKELLEALGRHDWYHAYSDDHRVWQRGNADANRLQTALEELSCPFEWWDIFKAIHGHAVEKYVEVSPNEFRNPEWQYSCIASQRREDLLTQAEIDNILAWFED